MVMKERGFWATDGKPGNSWRFLILGDALDVPCSAFVQTNIEIEDKYPSWCMATATDSMGRSFRLKAWDPGMALRYALSTYSPIPSRISMSDCAIGVEGVIPQG